MSIFVAGFYAQLKSTKNRQIIVENIVADFKPISFFLFFSESTGKSAAANPQQLFTKIHTIWCRFNTVETLKIFRTEIQMTNPHMSVPLKVNKLSSSQAVEREGQYSFTHYLYIRILGAIPWKKKKKNLKKYKNCYPKSHDSQERKILEFNVKFQTFSKKDLIWYLASKIWHMDSKK